MSVGTKIIQEALKEIGAHSIVQPADPESIEIGMNKLNSMLQLWLSDGIDLGIVPLSAPGKELGEPLDARQAIIDNLAIYCAPDFDNADAVVSDDLRRNASKGFNKIKDLYEVLSIPDKVVSSTLPRGAGERIDSRSATFRQPGSTIASSDA